MVIFGKAGSQKVVVDWVKKPVKTVSLSPVGQVLLHDPEPASVVDDDQNDGHQANDEH
jgi:hypothetical protein